MNTQFKFWGKTSTLFNNDNVEIHRIEGKVGGFSSEHRHSAKYNMFFVESGAIRITTWKDPSGKPDEGILEKHETCIIPPGLFHKFTVIEDCVVYEVYWVEMDPHDIERRNAGGFENIPVLPFRTENKELCANLKKAFDL